MNHYSHVIRFCILLAAVAVLFLIVRSLMVPESFGINNSYTYGYYRADSRAEQADIYPLHRGPEKCNACHEQQHNDISRAAHASIGCETCHGHWRAHNNNMNDVVVQDNSAEACMQCHQYLAARPVSFPQIRGFKEHLQDQDETYSTGMLCIECHNPHEPM